MLSKKTVLKFGVQCLVVTDKIMRVLLLILFFAVGGCKWFQAAGSPYFKWSNFKVPDGTPMFQQGFRDGCSTVLYSRGNVWYRARYDFRFDANLIGNSEYRFGHGKGYGWCFQQYIGSLGPRGSFDKYISPYGYDSTFDAGNINNAWGGMFGGGLGAPISVNPGNGFDAIFDVWQKGGSGTGSTVFGGNPLWAGGSSGQFFGQ